MFSESPGTPGRRQQMPRTMRSISRARAATPRRARRSSRGRRARSSSSTIAPAGPCACAADAARRSAARRCIGATSSRRYSPGPAVAGEVVEQLGEVGAELGVGREHAEVLVDASRSSGCSCRCRRGSSGGCRRPPGARRAGSWRASSARRARTRRATPACSSMRARSMFACSSKRAFSSTSATTCLPASAAFDERRDDAGLVAAGAVQRLLDREHVRVARGLVDERLDRVVANESYGWCTSTSPARSARKMSAVVAAGERGRGLRRATAGTSARAGAARRAPRAR